MLSVSKFVLFFVVFATLVNGQCSPGQYQVGTMCFDCFCGQFSTGGYVCTPCAPGFWSYSGSSSCSGSGTGYYTPDNCNDFPCDPGTYNDFYAASSCTPCSPGTYAAYQGSSSCTPCPPGTTSYSGATGCTPTSTNPSSPSGGGPSWSSNSKNSTGPLLNAAQTVALSVGGFFAVLTILGAVVYFYHKGHDDLEAPLIQADNRETTATSGYDTAKEI
jgi:hypothetical protein